MESETVQETRWKQRGRTDLPGPGDNIRLTFGVNGERDNDIALRLEGLVGFFFF